MAETDVINQLNRGFPTKERIEETTETIRRPLSDLIER